MKIFFFLFVILLSTRPAFANLADNIAQIMFSQKIEQLHEKALTCEPLEKDPLTGLNVSDWLKIQPPLPKWQMLTKIESTAKEAITYARSISGSDKRLHCLAGCFVARKLDYNSAVLVGWLKELSDGSDCSKKTSFEKRDYEATVKGAQAVHSKKTCERFCK